MQKTGKKAEPRKKGKKVEKRGCQTGGCMVLYLSAKRWDKRMTSEVPAEKREKRTNRRWKIPVSSEKSEAIQVQNVRNASKKVLDKKSLLW